jgi:preprotein translocase subunit SecA
MKWADMPEDQPIEHGLITKSIQQAQVRVEGYNFDMRKHVLEYDDVVNKQREVIYTQRRDVLFAENLREQIERITAEEIGDLVETYLPMQKDGDREDWRPQELYQAVLALYPVPAHVTPDQWDHMTAEEITLELTKGALEAYDGVERRLTPDIMPTAERFVMLRAIDTLWVRHLTDLDILREGIGLVGIGQRDPLVEYKREAFAMWQDLQDQIQRQIVQTIYRLELAAPPPSAAAQQLNPTKPSPGSPQAEAKLVANGQNKNAPTNGLGGSMNTINARNVKASLGALGGGPRPKAVSESAPQPIRADAWDKVGRNDPCPCGSGKKFKNCHYPELQRQRQTVDQSEVKRSINRRRH